LDLVYNTQFLLWCTSNNPMVDENTNTMKLLSTIKIHCFIPRVSWTKTKLQNLGHGPKAAEYQLTSTRSKAWTVFSISPSDGYYRHRIGFASNVMTSLQLSIDKRLSLPPRVQLFQVTVLSLSTP